jgi:hypothetical protein
MSEQDILDSQVYVGKYGNIPESSNVDTSNYDDTDSDEEVLDEDAERIALILGIDPRDFDDEKESVVKLGLSSLSHIDDKDDASKVVGAKNEL